jgi:hypothetical protein
MGLAAVVDFRPEIDKANGNGRQKYRDPITAQLSGLASTWESIHKTWQANERRANGCTPDGELLNPMLNPTLSAAAEQLMKIREGVGRELQKTLKKHILWSWLEQHPGVRGVHVARLVGLIADPLRFPGKHCEMKHHVPSDYFGLCPHSIQNDDEKWVVCETEIGPQRKGTGVRALWKYLGVHVEDGKSPRKRKGVQCSWNPRGRTMLLQPKGIADQIIQQRVEPWRGIYDKKKAALGFVPKPAIEETGGAENDVADVTYAIEGDNGREGGADPCHTIEGPNGPALRPFQLNGIARKVAVKAFVADLLMEWKRRA